MTQSMATTFSPSQNQKALEEKLIKFYEKPTDYSAFQEASYHPGPWNHVLESIRSVKVTGRRVRVLESGCGRTGFAGYLEANDLRDSVELHLHDVTSANAAYLERAADEVHLGGVNASSAGFDIVFSTYVWEHLVDPKSVLESWISMLKPGGSLFIFSPRYDFPGYLNPSIDHLARNTRWSIAAKVIFCRCRTLLIGRASFLIEDDPAVFHLPWRTDRDAVHWASLFDLKAELKGRGELSSLNLPYGPSWRDWLLKRWLTVAVRFRPSGQGDEAGRR
jgi:SAM-dependent methyltransferase